MKEVHGQTLESALQQLHAASEAGQNLEGPTGWTLRRVIEAFHRACEAVAYAHARGVVHRDLKPSNVMLGAFGEVLVVDWGLARVMGSSKQEDVTGDMDPVVTDRSRGELNATRCGQIAGTPASMAPEQARGELHRIGPVTDVYALGATLYAILSGHAPYHGTDALTVLQQVLRGPPPPPDRRSGQRDGEMPAEKPAEMAGEVTGVITGGMAGVETLMGTSQLDAHLNLAATHRLADGDPRVPEVLRAICARAMAWEPADRFPEAGDLALELRLWLDQTARRERAMAAVEAADALQTRVTGLQGRADALRKQAIGQLAHLEPHDPVAKKQAAWALEDEAARLELEADLNEVSYRHTLRGALTHAPDLPEAHDRLAEHYRQEHASAERVQDEKSAARAELLLRSYEHGRYATYLKGDGALTLVTEPAGAEVELYRFESLERRRVPVFLRSLGRTPLLKVPLSMGSYLLKVKGSDRVEVRCPVFLSRLEHCDGIRPGGSEPHPVYLPAPGELEPEDVYVPLGRPGDHRSEGVQIDLNLNAIPGPIKVVVEGGHAAAASIVRQGAPSAARQAREGLFFVIPVEVLVFVHGERQVSHRARGV